MRGSTLYSVLIKMSNKELIRFEKFLDSPYFNTKSESKELLTIYLNEQKKKGLGNLKKEHVFKLVFGSTSYNDSKLRLLYSHTYKMLKHFLIIDQIDLDHRKSNLLLADSYTRLGKTNLFQKTIEKTKEGLVQIPHRDMDYYLDNYQLERKDYENFTSKNRTTDNKLKKQLLNIDVFYFIVKLRQGCLILSSKNVVLNEMDMAPIDFVVKTINNNESLLNEHPSLAVYFHCYQTLLNPNSEEKFKKFKSLLLNNIHKYKIRDARELLIAAINFCAKKINYGERSYAFDVFEIYILGIDHKILIPNNSISPFTYKNIVSVAVTVGEYEWTEIFIKDHTDKLPAKQRKDVHTYCLAKLKDASGEKDEAIKLLMQFYSEDVLFTLGANLMLIKILFEEKYLELLTSHLEKMTVYINRKKEMSYHKEQYKKVVSITKKLLNLPPYGSKERLKLKEEIKNPTIKTLEKDWFLAQVQQKKGAS